MNTITVLIVDDHDAARRELAARLNREKGLEVVAQVSSSADATRTAAALRPNVILADIKRADSAGLDLVRRLRLTTPDSALIVLTSFFDERECDAVLKFGTSAYLLKEVDPQHLIAEIKKQSSHSKGSGAPWIQVR